MGVPHPERSFAALKLKVYQRGVLLGALTTTIVLLISRLGQIRLWEGTILISAFMALFCLASAVLFGIFGARYVPAFEGIVFTVIFAYFLTEFVYRIWLGFQSSSIEFGVYLLWIPLLYIVSFVIFRSRRALWASLAFFVCILLVGTAYFVLSRGRLVQWPDILLLTQVYSASLIYISLLFIIAMLKDQYGEAQIHSERMTTLAMMDDLTGVHNRRKIDDLLEAFIADFRDHGRPFSVIMLDVDDFKRINDTYGHDVGDYVLKRVVEVLRSNVRESDQIGRWGGDEFFIFYPDTDGGRVRRLAERTAAAVRKADFEHVGHVTLSLGMATSRPDDTAESLWKRADEALYMAKREKSSG
jgi:diguanylate cyclase (GGDEF)-like protein